MLSEEEICAVLVSNDFDLEKKASLLIAMANEKGGADSDNNNDESSRLINFSGVKNDAHLEPLLHK